MLIKIKSLSPLFHSIIKNIDDRLSSIPSVDTEGCDVEDSLIFDSCVSSVENSNTKDRDGRYHYPVDKTLAITLIYNELQTRRKNKQGEDMSIVKKTIELFGEPAKITNTPNYDDAFKVIEEQFKNIIKVTDATGAVLKSTKDLCNKTLHLSVQRTLKKVNFQKMLATKKKLKLPSKSTRKIKKKRSQKLRKHLQNSMVKLTNQKVMK